MSRSLLHDWECAINKCCREDNPTGMIDIAEDIYNTAYVRGKNNSIEVKEILDKIRDEIESQRKEVSNKKSENNELQAFYFGLNDGLKDARDIIDKYREENKE